jgi:hypothetical protein
MILTDPACDLPLRVASVEIRGRSRRLDASGVDGPHPVVISVELAISGMPQPPDELLHAANRREGPIVDTSLHNYLVVLLNESGLSIAMKK